MQHSHVISPIIAFGCLYFASNFYKQQGRLGNPLISPKFRYRYTRYFLSPETQFTIPQKHTNNVYIIALLCVFQHF